MRAEHAPEERLVAPNLWATLSVHVVASPASHAALEVAGLSVHSFLLTLMVKLGFSGRALQLSARLVSSAAHGEITDGVVRARSRLRAMHACELQLLHPQNALAKCV